MRKYMTMGKKKTKKNQITFPLVTDEFGHLRNFKSILPIVLLSVCRSLLSFEYFFSHRDKNKPQQFYGHFVWKSCCWGVFWAKDLLFCFFQVFSADAEDSTVVCIAIRTNTTVLLITKRWRKNKFDEITPS